jgi:hypothetical protein
MLDKFVLDGKTPVHEPDLLIWAKWFGNSSRKVAYTQHGDVEVSTVFLGMNHNFDDTGDPILFETMVFGGENDKLQVRYHTWEEAEAGHERICKQVFPERT